MKFSAWKKSMLADGNFRDLAPGPKAAYLVRNAKASWAAGEFDRSGDYTMAIRWAYRVNYSAAWLEDSKRPPALVPGK